MLHIYGYSENVRAMADRTSLKAASGVALIGLGGMGLMLDIFSSGLPFHSWWIYLAYIVFGAMIFQGVLIALVNAVRCALYTNEYERLRAEAALEEAENMEEPR